MKRYFYTDPFAAAWMTTHHGVTYVNDLPHGQGHCFQVISRASGWADASPYDLILPCNGKPRVYIHPDSLHLLEPQVGDLLRGDEHTMPQIRYMDLPDSEQMGTGAALMRRGFKIIQRNGIPFMWPEHE